MNSKRNISLIFSGGGARGSFQIGVWKAMKELGLDRKIKAVFGSSVGAINGAAFVQGDYHLAEEIWKRINYKTVFDDENFALATRRSRKYYYSMARAIIKDRGLNVDPLKNLLRAELDEEKLRDSPIEFGFVVYDLSNRKPRYMKKEDIPKGQLIEFIIAGATFPIFQPHRIDNEIFIDGGVFDNRPVDFLENQEGITRVICVDVTIARHFWPNKKVKKEVEILFLRPSKLLGSPLAFRPSRITKNLELGYRDGFSKLSQFA